MDFIVPTEILELQEKIREFINKEIIPLEDYYNYQEGRLPVEICEQARAKVKKAGLWTCIPPKIEEKLELK